MNVSAQDKSTGNVKKITIKNEKGRLSQSDIDKMVADAEKFKAQDEEVRKKVEAKNALEGYCFGVRNSLTQEQFAAVLKESDKELINREINEVLGWIDCHKEAEVSEFESKQKELESKIMPIMQAAHQAAGGGGAGAGGMPGGIDPSMFANMAGGAGASGSSGFSGGAPPGGSGGGGSRGPRVEEVD
jgi:L1 cell adhesion molecule like protein